MCCNVVGDEILRFFEAKCGVESKFKPINNLMLIYAVIFSFIFLIFLWLTVSYCLISADVHSDPEELVEPEEEEEPKGQKPTTTPPSTPVRAEEGRLA